ncbi:hypothetical protein CERSUDRAFT_80307 [Gelatoporia subvermispora B]|uniref:Uncharacterized protein n=1 Tax=Ceriporiopsis subvermispora (strain B) TaxID=914234 RepID=M2PV46_CERS8|nr:hypothetical protein CERSUDRAFT_80307 [Gelatoporia subvermispora B]
MAAQDTTFKHLLTTGKQHIARLPQRYRKLSTKAKLFIWATGCLYLTLGTIFVVVGPDRIGQTFYDLAQKTSHKPFGWAILLATLDTLEQ